jgi:hypothetical protein
MKAQQIGMHEHGGSVRMSYNVERKSCNRYTMKGVTQMRWEMIMMKVPLALGKLLQILI